VVEEVAKADAEVMVQQTAPRTPNSIQAQKHPAGLVVLMSTKSIIVIPRYSNRRWYKGGSLNEKKEFSKWK
jgi:hypothetical protein